MWVTRPEDFSGWLMLLCGAVGTVIFPVLFTYVNFFRKLYVCIPYLFGVIYILCRSGPPPSSSSDVDTIDMAGSLQQPSEIGIQLQQLPPSSSSFVGTIAENLGVFNYKCRQQQDEEEEETEECVICLCEYQEEDAVAVLTPCHHNFHLDCIRRWLQCQPRCPICNACLLQKLGSPAQTDVVPLAAGNMTEENRGSEGNV